MVVAHAEPWQGLQLLAHASPGLPLEPEELPLLEPPLEPPLDPVPLDPPLDPVPLDPPLLDPDAVASPPSVGPPELPPFLKLPHAAAMAAAPSRKAKKRSSRRESMVAQCVRAPPSCQPAGASVPSSTVPCQGLSPSALLAGRHPSE
jgi:hypothetical protein